MLTRKCLVEQMARLAVAYNKEIKPEQETVYEEALSKYTDYVLALAVSNVIIAEKFFPVPAVLVTHCQMVKEDLARNSPHEEMKYAAPEVTINGKNISELCKSTLCDFINGKITRELLEDKMIKLERGLAPHVPDSAINAAIQRIKEIGRNV